jgi:hypothetical protein
MTKLDTPDLCARLDRLKDLCDRLEDAQSNPRRYQELVQKIRLETDAFRATICGARDPVLQ